VSKKFYSICHWIWLESPQSWYKVALSQDLRQDVADTKLFSSSTTVAQNKLDRSSLQSIFKLVKFM
jgi:hypothetical protein